MVITQREVIVRLKQRTSDIWVLFQEVRDSWELGTDTAIQTT